MIIPWGVTSGVRAKFEIGGLISLSESGQIGPANRNGRPDTMKLLVSLKKSMALFVHLVMFRARLGLEARAWARPEGLGFRFPKPKPKPSDRASSPGIGLRTRPETEFNQPAIQAYFEVRVMFQMIYVSHTIP